jgi:hypothetical protein
MNNLDKRVTSRLQNKYIQFFSLNEIKDRINFFKDFLIFKGAHKLIPIESLKKFNKSIEEVFDDDDVIKLLYKRYDIYFYVTLLVFIVLIKKEIILNLKHPILKKEDFIDNFESLSVDYRLEVIKDLTQMDLFILLTIKRIEQINIDNNLEERIKFNVIFSEINKFVYGTKNKIKKNDQFGSEKLILQNDFSQNNILKSLEYLIDLGFISINKSKSNQSLNSTILGFFFILFL